MKQFSDQGRIRFNSQFIIDFSMALQIVLIYFNGTIISTSVVPSSPVQPVTFSLKLNEWLVLLLAQSSISPATVKTGSSL